MILPPPASRVISSPPSILRSQHGLRWGGGIVDLPVKLVKPSALIYSDHVVTQKGFFSLCHRAPSMAPLAPEPPSPFRPEPFLDFRDRAGQQLVCSQLLTRLSCFTPPPTSVSRCQHVLDGGMVHQPAHPADPSAVLTLVAKILKEHINPPTN